MAIIIIIIIAAIMLITRSVVREHAVLAIAIQMRLAGGGARQDIPRGHSDSSPCRPLPSLFVLLLSPRQVGEALSGRGHGARGHHFHALAARHQGRLLWRLMESPIRTPERRQVSRSRAEAASPANARPRTDVRSPHDGAILMCRHIPVLGR